MSHNSSQKSSQSQPSSQQTVSSDPSSQQTLSETSSRNSSQSSQPQPFNNELNDLLIIRLDEQILGKEDFNHERVVALLPGRTVDILIR